MHLSKVDYGTPIGIRYRDEKVGEPWRGYLDLTHATQCSLELEVTVYA